MSITCSCTRSYKLAITVAATLTIGMHATYISIKLSSYSNRLAGIKEINCLINRKVV